MKRVCVCVNEINLCYSCLWCSGLQGAAGEDVDTLKNQRKCVTAIWGRCMEALFPMMHNVKIECSFRRSSPLINGCQTQVLVFSGRTETTSGRSKLPQVTDDIYSFDLRSAAIQIKWITSTEELLFPSVCVDLSAGSHENYTSGFHHTWMEDESRPRRDLLKTWCGSRDRLWE